MKKRNATEFLKMVPTVCNDIVNFKLYNYELISTLVEPLSNIIKLQPLKRLFISLVGEKIPKKFYIDQT